jgi:hypothetical protein
MRPTISNPRKKIARRDATPRRARFQFDDGGNIAVSAFDRNDLRGRHLQPRQKVRDGERIEQHRLWITERARRC